MKPLKEPTLASHIKAGRVDLYRFQEMPQEAFLDPEVCQRWYTQEGYHRLYIADIRAAFVR